MCVGVRVARDCGNKVPRNRTNELDDSYARGSPEIVFCSSTYTGCKMRPQCPLTYKNEGHNRGTKNTWGYTQLCASGTGTPKIDRSMV